MPDIARVIDKHSELAGLTTGDGHTQYPLLAGRAGGQTLYGSNAANGDLRLEGTSDATKTSSYVLLQQTGGSVGIGTATPGEKLEVYESSLSANIRLSGRGGSDRTVMAVLDFYNNHPSSLTTAAQIKSLRGISDFKAGQLGFFTAAAATGTLSERMTINEAGNIGIGTTAPLSPMHVVGLLYSQIQISDGVADTTNKRPGIVATSYLTSEEPYAFITGFSGDGYNHVYLGGGSTIANAATALKFFTGAANTLTGTQRVEITSAGLVGIGTTLPQFRMHVSSPNSSDTQTLGAASGGLGISGSNKDFGLQFGVLNTGSAWIQVGRNDGAATAYDLYLQTLGGKTGVGTAAPDSLLHVSNTTATNNAVAQVLTISNNVTGAGVAANGFGSRILWEGESSTTEDRTMAAIDVAWSDATDATRTSAMMFSTVNSAGALTERMRITGAGNVGIGSSAASYTLEVVRTSATSTVYIGTLTSGQANVRVAGAYSETNPAWHEQRSGGAVILMNYDSTPGNYSTVCFKDASSYTVAQMAGVNYDHANHGGYLELWGRVASGSSMKLVTFRETAVVKISGTALRATTEGTNHLDIFNGTAPVGTLANGISIYSDAGECYIMDATGNATLQSPHDPETGEWIFWSRNTVTGRTYRVDMERMVAAIEALTGQSFTTETFESLPN